MKKSYAKHATSIVALAACATSQSLLDAISGYPELSNFTALMTDNPALAGALLTSNRSSLSGPSTVLVPDNSAFTKVSALYNVSMQSLSIEQLEPYLQYHLLVGQVTTENLTAELGVTVPTFLTGPQYNNRSAGTALGSDDTDNSDTHDGQVVFLQAESNKGGGRLTMRQLENPVYAQGGLGQQIVSKSWISSRGSLRTSSIA